MKFKIRGTDCQGSGAYGASRGSRTHNGIDICAVRNEAVTCFESGIHTKVGNPYSQDGDKRKFRYVEITVQNGNRHRYFYVESLVRIGADVERGEIIGWAQGIESAYEGMTPHFHFEIKKPDGSFIDPKEYLEGLGYEF